MAHELLTLLTGAALAIWPGAASDAQWQACAGDDAVEAIEGCSAILEAPDESDAARAVAFYNRGLAYHCRSRRARAMRDEGAGEGGSDIDRAIRDYDEALRLRPQSPAALTNRGVAYYEKGAWERAIEDYDRAIGLAPDLAEAFNNRALANLKLNRYDRARQDFDRTIQLNQNYGNALITILLGASRRPGVEPRQRNLSTIPVG